MYDPVHAIAAALSRVHTDRPRLIAAGEDTDSGQWRSALRQGGVPVLEVNDLPPPLAMPWLAAARAFSAEYLVPVVLLGDQVPAEIEESLAGYLAEGGAILPAGSREVDDLAWLQARLVAITRAVETSPLNLEFRRSRERRGWIRVGWYPDAALESGNGLLLAWSSPLPLRRIRDFAARCPEITLYAPDAEAIAQEVAAQGISVTGWRFAVK